MMVYGILTVTYLTVVSLAWAMMPDASRGLIRRRIYSEMSQEKPFLLSPLVKLLAPLHRRLATGRYARWMSHRIDGAGLRLPWVHVLVSQELGAAAGGVMYLATMGTARLQPEWLLFFVGTGVMIPLVWLNNQSRARRMMISRDLPEVADLLTLCVGAGMDFVGALARIVKEFRPCPVRQELAITLQEIRVGKRRQDALRAFAQRVGMPEAMTFARSIIQADRMGTGLVDAMRVLSEDMRLQRYHWAERFAQQAPMKMLLPLVMSLGASMVIVAGPILIRFLRGGFRTAL